MQTLEIRSFEIRDVNLDAREVTGLAVPYDTVSNNETFAQGAAIPAENTMLFWAVSYTHLTLPTNREV